MKYSVARRVMIGLPLAATALLAVLPGKQQQSFANAEHLRSNTSPAASADNSSTTSKPILNEFLTWPMKSFLFDDDDNQSSITAYPLLTSQYQEHQVDESNILFSFPLSGSALRRHQRRRQEEGKNSIPRQLGGSTEEGGGDDTHEMVVHVSYEDICE